MNQQQREGDSQNRMIFFFLQIFQIDELIGNHLQEPLLTRHDLILIENVILVIIGRPLSEDARQPPNTAAVLAEGAADGTAAAVATLLISIKKSYIQEMA